MNPLPAEQECVSSVPRVFVGSPCATLHDLVRVFSIVSRAEAAYLDLNESVRDGAGVFASVFQLLPCNSVMRKRETRRLQEDSLSVSTRLELTTDDLKPPFPAGMRVGFHLFVSFPLERLADRWKVVALRSFFAEVGLDFFVQLISWLKPHSLTHKKRK